MAMEQLYAIPGSGFSERVVWAAQLCGASVRVIAFDPSGVGELLLRLKTWTWSGTVTAPALVTKAGLLCDSLEVAYQLDQRSARKLFPPGSIDEIRRWHEASNVLLAQGRACFFQNAHLPEAQQALCPGPLKALGWLGQLIFASVLRVLLVRLTSKFRAATAASSMDKCREALDQVRAALKGNKRYLVGDSLTFADLSIASALNMVAITPDLPATYQDPSAMQYLQLPQSFARDYADLLEWRAQLLKQHPYKWQWK